MSPAATLSAEVVHDVQMVLGEGPRWFSNQLHWVDIERGRQWQWRPGEEPRYTEHPHSLAAVGPADAGTVLLLDDAVALQRVDGGWHTVDVPGVDPARGRLNDARADSRGRLWFGSLTRGPRTDEESLYCLDGGTVRRVRSGLSLSNGIAFDPDETMLYHADTLNRVVTRSSFDAASGRLGEPTAFLEFSQDLPDGIATDAGGGLWVAFWGGGRVERFDAGGRRTAVVHTPGAELTTAMCLGDGDLRTLYITTATDGEDGHGTHAGAVYCVRVDVPGMPEAAVRWKEPTR